MNKTLLSCGMALIFCSLPILSLAQPAQLTIADSVRLALAHSPAVKAAAAETARRSWLVKENQAANLPTLSATHNQNQNHPGTVDSPANSHATSLEARMTLYNGGLIEGNIAQTKELYTGAQHTLAYTRQQVITNTYLAYYNVLQAEKNMVLADEAVQRLTQHLAVVNAQYADGIVIKSDVLRTEVELAQAKQTFSNSQNAYKLASSRFITLLGLPADQDIALTEIGEPSAYDNSIDQAVQTALTQRTDLKQTYQDGKAAEQGIPIAKSGHLPTVSLSLTKDWQSRDSATDPLSTQLTVSFNLFDGNKTNARIKQAEEELIRTNEVYTQKAEQVTLETKEAYFNLHNARTAADIASQVVAKAEEDYAIAKVRYQSGVGDNLDVIDSQVALTTAKLNYTNARYDCHKYSVQLAQAMGTITADISLDNSTKLQMGF